MNSMIKSIVKSNLKENKLKNILIIITVALTTCLLSSIGIITYTSFIYSKDNAIKNSGNAHGYYRKLEETDIFKLKQHKDIEAIGENSFTIGKQEIDNTLLTLMYIDETALALSNMKLIEGNMPVKENEIVLDQFILNKLGCKDKIGEKIKLSYNDTNKKLIEREFILSGVLSKNEVSEGNNITGGIVSKKLLVMENYDSRLKASIMIKNETKLSSSEIKVKLEEIAADFHIPKENIQFNSMYLFFTRPDPTVIIGAATIALIVMISSILVIYNIFYISIINKIQEFGKLKAIGATKKQLKSIILREGIILSTISIPIGIIAGYLLSRIIISNILTDSGTPITYISFPIIIGSAMLTFVTVYLSLLKPMKIASKISPVEAIKYTNGDKISNKKTRSGYIDLDIIKLTKANLVRNKRRTFITLLSLSLSGILIMTATSIFSSINTENYVRQSIAGDFQFRIKYSSYDYDKEREEFIRNNPLNENFINTIRSINGVENVNEVREVEATIPNTGKHAKESPESKEAEIEFASYTDDMLKALNFNLLEGKIDLEKIKSGEEVIATSSPRHWFDIHAGDVIPITFGEDANKTTKEVTVQAVTALHYGGDFITSIDLLKNPENLNYNMMISVDVKNGKEEEVGEILNELSSNHRNLKYNDFKEELKQAENSFFSMNSMAYSFVAILGVISLINLINTMITSIISRKKEIGILQAIGMTDVQLLKMLKLEGLFYTLVTLFSSLVVGSIVGYLGYLAFYNNGATYAIYKFQLIPAIILATVMIIVQLFMGRVINKIFKNESLIDRIRYSE